MNLCPVCGAKLEPYFIENTVGKPERYYLQHGKKQEPAFFCPNATPHDGHGMNLWTETSAQNWVAMQKRQEEFKARI